LTAEVFLIFLNRLIAKRSHKLLWIVDRHPVHQAVKAFRTPGHHRDDLLAALRRL